MNDLSDLGDVDPVTRTELRRLAVRNGGPCVSIFLPTHRYRPDIQQDPLRLRRLLDDAHDRLCALGLKSAQAWELLAPHRELLGRLEFWLHQSHGLALFAAPGFHRRYRVPVALAEEVTVGTNFRVRPLLGLPSAETRFHVLALSPHRVRLFAGTPTTFAELPLGAVPPDLAAAVAFDDVERQSHQRSPGGRDEKLHGHGGDDAPSEQEFDRFLRAVDRGLRAALGSEPVPLVLAGVARDVDQFRAITTQVDVLKECVPGNPDLRNLRELHDLALAIAAPALDAERNQAVHHAQITNDDHIVIDLNEIARAASEGRIASLLVSDRAPIGPWAGDTLDRAIAETLEHGGSALAVPVIDLRNIPAPAAAAVEESGAMAVLRY